MTGSLQQIYHIDWQPVWSIVSTLQSTTLLILLLLLSNTSARCIFNCCRCLFTCWCIIIIHR